MIETREIGGLPAPARLFFKHSLYSKKRIFKFLSFSKSQLCLIFKQYRFLDLNLLSNARKNRSDSNLGWKKKYRFWNESKFDRS
ncbi:hypothetical protein DLM76_13955 [Leptospira yasudae]|uniref:Uncharacterized protein n=1 Tax=Leptospira yasudae TaxID=2202201 RepID=A0ABX9M425_9LEPT|nr:hypothetical protein DLM77_08900 [Leptospira yasudae]RHX94064.1 hypothetical protein DLM76_13955 [Leptospira yasudae]